MCCRTVCEVKMNVHVYKFHISYDDFSEKIWREVEVSGNSRLSELGYLILATFDTLAEHAFEFEIDNKRYGLDTIIKEGAKDLIDVSTVKISELGLQENDRFAMIYDYGTTQSFTITVEEIKPMERGAGRRYPCLSDGSGKGILDNVSPHDFGNIITQIDSTGISNHLYKTEHQDDVLWDYRQFDLESSKIILKVGIERVRAVYEKN